MNTDLDHTSNPHKVAQLLVSDDGEEVELWVDGVFRSSWVYEHAKLQTILCEAVSIGMYLGDRKLARELREKLGITRRTG